MKYKKVLNTYEIQKKILNTNEIQKKILNTNEIQKNAKRKSNSFLKIVISHTKFNGLILLYCLTYMSFSRVSGAYDHKTHKGKILDFWKSYARD